MIRKYECKFTSYVVYRISTEKEVLLFPIAGALSVEDVQLRMMPEKELNLLGG